MTEFALPDDAPPRKKKRKSNVPLFVLWVVLFPLVALGAIAFIGWRDSMQAQAQAENERGRQLGKQWLDQQGRR